MSWFDAAGFANLAKSALKGAQKTIDKALDIKEDDQKALQSRADESADFFATWGLKNEDDASQQEKNKDPRKDGSSSIWGSFTGSFFESPKLGEGGQKRSMQTRSLQSTPVEDVQRSPLSSSHSLPESYTEQDLKDEALEDKCEDMESEENVPDTASASDIDPQPNPPCEEEEENSSKSLVSCTAEDASITAEKVVEPQEVSPMENRSNIENADKTQDADRTEPELSDNGKKGVSDPESNDSHSSNRISVASVGSDKKSLESVEILGSRSNTDCTTTPESDGNSSSASISPAIGQKVNSESVEILPDSLVTSPSSVEILGDLKSDTSPYLSPMEPRDVEPAAEIERDESVTPCWEDIDVNHAVCDRTKTEPSSSDITPYESPMEEVKTLNSASCASSVDSTPSAGVCPLLHPNRGAPAAHALPISPESVEVITDIDELDEGSFAEDTYTSASEGTVMTVVENPQQFEQVKSRLDGSIKSQLTLSLDSLKEKPNLHLPLEAITTQPIRKPENLEGTAKKEMNTYDRLISATIEPSEPEDSEVTGPAKSEKSEQTTEAGDQYLMLTDSSCEGTLIESSSEENPAPILKAETKVLETPLTASSYVKTMLADAMVDKGEAAEVEVRASEVPRENSPISSESRSDLVKIGSDQTSGHTSGDELETTTSSDIEIISSPNGDSSSTQSRQSPAKLQLAKSGDLLTKTLKTRGHSRELSEISIGSDDANFEIEKLLRRIQEMTEILEARESKLIDVSRMNMELHEQNSHLKKQLDNFEKHAEQSQNLNQITDEYTQRLSALERKFQQAIRERDSLRKNLEHLKAEAATRLSSQEMSTINAEKDEIIKELREEGEKLSKQQLQHSNIIKKLRVKEKENDTIIKNLKEQIEEQNSELERLKRSLHAKEEVERSQIEAVHMLTAKSKKQEKEIMSLQEKLDNALHKMDAYKRSLDAAKTELTETKEILGSTEVELKEAVSNAGESCQLFAQVEDLKMKLRQTEEVHAKKEEFFKHENTELLKRLEVAEARSEDLSESVSIATKPLLRQLEQLQASLVHKTNSFMKQEKALSDTNIELQAKIESLVEADNFLKEENVNLRAKVSQLESKLSAKEAEKVKIQESHEKSLVESEKLVECNTRQQQQIEALEQSHASQVKELQREISALENKLATEKAAADAERRRNNAMMEQQQSVDDVFRLSPTSSIGRESESSNSSVWPVLNESIPDISSGRYGMLYDSVRVGSSSTSIIENLQAQLKQRDGEVQQLQWELSRRNTERDALNTELATLSVKVEDLNSRVAEAQTLNENLAEIQTRYDALLQMYGEKMEENQELRLDLEDVKEMYKTQIDQLLKRDA